MEVNKGWSESAQSPPPARSRQIPIALTSEFAVKHDNTEDVVERHELKPPEQTVETKAGGEVLSKTSSGLRVAPMSN